MANYGENRKKLDNIGNYCHLDKNRAVRKTSRNPIFDMRLIFNVVFERVTVFDVLRVGLQTYVQNHVQTQHNVKYLVEHEPHVKNHVNNNAMSKPTSKNSLISKRT